MFQNLSRKYLRNFNWSVVSVPAIGLLGIALLGLTIGGCAGAKGMGNVPSLVKNAKLTADGEPSHITVQHVLIGFRGSLPGKNITRTREEAKILAQEVLARAQAGDNFAELVNEYTDDSPPGIYHMANFDQPSDDSPADVEDKVFPRHGMVPAFGDVGFPLDIGQIGISEHGPGSPYGWHIVKRIR